MEVEDHTAASKVLESSSESVRWEEYVAPIMESAEGGDYDPANPYPDGLSEVYY